MERRLACRRRPDEPPLSVVISGREDGVCSVECAGEIGIRTVQRFRDGLHGAVEEATRQLVIDLRRVTRMDSVGVCQIVDVAKRLPPGATLRICSQDPGICVLLKIAGLGDAAACPQG